MSFPRLSSENQSNLCPLEGSLSFLWLDFVLGCIDTGLLLPPLLFGEAGVYPHREGNGFPMHPWRFNLRFNVVRILWTSPVIFHGRLWRFATQIIEVFFLFAQRWTVLHNPRLVKIHVEYSTILNDGICTGGWFWIHSRNFSLMTTVNYFVNDCPNLNSLPLFLPYRSSLGVRVQLLHLSLIISTLEIALANIPWDVLVLMSTLEIVLPNILRDVFVLLNVAAVRQCNKVDFPYIFVLCAFFKTCFHSFCIVAFSSGINFLVWKICYSYFSVSRSMRLWETDLQSLLNHT